MGVALGSLEPFQAYEIVILTKSVEVKSKVIKHQFGVNYVCWGNESLLTMFSLYNNFV